MEPDIWGPSFWFSLHNITFNYPFQPTDEEKSDVKNFFQLLNTVLPCKICRVHYMKHIYNYPIEPSLNCRADLIKWLIDIHNVVNKMLGKQIYTLEEVLQLYEEKHGHPISLYPHTTEIKTNQYNNNSIEKRVNRKQLLLLVLACSIILSCGIWIIVKNRNLKRKT